MSETAIYLSSKGAAMLTHEGEYSLDRQARRPYDRTPQKGQGNAWCLCGGKSGIGAWRSLVAHLLWEQRVG
ncbi:MAG TPA: hypothetical protein PKH39_17915, partial [Woeseiaceae bacterium]|nr:hypothetical protein [Woeseiaceae bacterium]